MEIDSVADAKKKKIDESFAKQWNESKSQDMFAEDVDVKEEENPRKSQWMDIDPVKTFEFSGRFSESPFTRIPEQTPEKSSVPSVPLTLIPLMTQTNTSWTSDLETPRIKGEFEGLESKCGNSCTPQSRKIENLNVTPSTKSPMEETPIPSPTVLCKNRKRRYPKRQIFKPLFEQKTSHKNQDIETPSVSNISDSASINFNDTKTTTEETEPPKPYKNRYEEALELECKKYENSMVEDVEFEISWENIGIAEFTAATAGKKKQNRASQDTLVLEKSSNESVKAEFPQNYSNSLDTVILSQDSERNKPTFTQEFFQETSKKKSEEKPIRIEDLDLRYLFQHQYEPPEEVDMKFTNTWTEDYSQLEVAPYTSTHVCRRDSFLRDMPVGMMTATQFGKEEDERNKIFNTQSLEDLVEDVENDELLEKSVKKDDTPKSSNSPVFSFDFGSAPEIVFKNSSNPEEKKEENGKIGEMGDKSIFGDLSVWRTQDFMSTRKETHENIDAVEKIHPEKESGEGKKIFCAGDSGFTTKAKFEEKIDKNIFLEEIPSTSKNLGFLFTTGSGKPIKLNEKTMENAQKIYENLQNSCADEIPSISKSGLTKDGKSIEVEKIDENIFPEEIPSTSKFGLTKSGKSIEIEEKIDENIFPEEIPSTWKFELTKCGKSIEVEEKIDENIFPEEIPSTLKFGITKSGKSIEILEKIDENTFPEAIPSTSKNFGFLFTTGTGKSIKLNEKTVENAQKIYENLQNTCTEEIPSFGLTKSGKSIEVEEKINENIFPEEISSTSEFGLTKSEKSIEIEEKIDKNIFPEVIPSTSKNLGFLFTTGSGKSIKINEKTVENAQKIYENLQNTCIEEIPSFGLTKSGKSIEVEKIDENFFPEEIPSTSKFGVTKSGKSIEIEEKIDENIFPEEIPSTSKSLGLLFTTGSGKSIKFNKKTLENAQKIYENLQNSCAEEIPSFGLTKSEKSIEVEEKIDENIFPEEIPLTPKNLGFVFTTGSGKSIKLNEKTMENAQKIYEKINENPQANENILVEIEKKSPKNPPEISTANKIQKNIESTNSRSSRYSLRTREKLALPTKNCSWTTETSPVKNTSLKPSYSWPPSDPEIDQALDKASFSLPPKNQNFSGFENEEIETSLIQAKKFGSLLEIYEKDSHDPKFSETFPKPFNDKILPTLEEKFSEETIEKTNVTTRKRKVEEVEIRPGPSKIMKLRENERKIETLEEDVKVSPIIRKTRKRLRNLHGRKILHQIQEDEKRDMQHFQNCSDESADISEQEQLIREKTKNLKPEMGFLLKYKKENKNRRISWKQVVGTSNLVPRNLSEFSMLEINPKVLGVTASNAASYIFDTCEIFGKKSDGKETAFVPLGKSRLFLDENKRAGVAEFSRAFLASPGVDPSLVPSGWLENHYGWIVWKLAAMDRTKFGSACMPRALTVPQVMEQLKYRYDREIDGAERPIIRKILEKDAVSSQKMVLCVICVKQDSKPEESAMEQNKWSLPSVPSGYSLQVTDGWYSISIACDFAMLGHVNSGKIKEGTKIVTCLAELLNCQQGCHPLQKPSNVCLKIHTNSTRRAKWYAKLGAQPNAEPISVKLKDIDAHGGVIGKMNVVIARIYPVLYREKTQDGQSIFRNARSEEKAVAAFEQECQIRAEALYVTAEKSLGRGQFNDIPDCDLMVSESQSKIILAEREEEQERFKKNLDREMRASMPTPRNVTAVLKVRLVDQEFQAMATLWSEVEDFQSMFKEGSCVNIYNATASGKKCNELQLNCSRSTRFEEVPSKKLPYHCRVYTPIFEACQPGFNPPFSEFDTVGIVCSIISEPKGTNNCQAINIAHPNEDESGSSFLSLYFSQDISTYGYGNILAVGSTVACINVELRKALAGSIPTGYNSERTIFTCNPRQPHLREAFDRLRKLVRDTTSYVKKCDEEMSQQAEHKLKSVGNPNFFNKSYNSSFVQSPADKSLSISASRSSLNKRKLEKLSYYSDAPSLSFMQIDTTPNTRSRFKPVLPSSSKKLVYQEKSNDLPMK